MQIEQTLQELFWNSTDVASLPSLVVRLVLASVLGLLLGQVYVHFGQALSNRKLFARNFILLTVTTTLIISIVRSSVALSLGLVGALSIVRFGAAIKEPEELAFLFIAITVGLGLGAGAALVTIVALLIILGLIALRSLLFRQSGPPNLYLTVTSPGTPSIGARQILDTLTATGASATLKRFDQTADLVEAAFVVDFKDVDRLEEFNQQLRKLSPQVRISCLDDRGLGG
jgi:uncharacterized membrane protein YhiD involved in acid resistance